MSESIDLLTLCYELTFDQINVKKDYLKNRVYILLPRPRSLGKGQVVIKRNFSLSKKLHPVGAKNQKADRK